MNIFVKSSLYVGCSLGVLINSAPLYAQNSNNEDAYTGLTEITVTARKREESVQDVPVVVTAISGETIERRDITSIEKIASARLT